MAYSFQRNLPKALCWSHRLPVCLLMTVMRWVSLVYMIKKWIEHLSSKSPTSNPLFYEFWLLCKVWSFSPPPFPPPSSHPLLLLFIFSNKSFSKSVFNVWFCIYILWHEWCLQETIQIVCTQTCCGGLVVNPPPLVLKCASLAKVSGCTCVCMGKCMCAWDWGRELGGSDGNKWVHH